MQSNSSYGPGHGLRVRLARAALLALGLAALGAIPAGAQTGTVSGQVLSGNSGEPVVGAQVSQAGTTRRTVTDPQGNFRLDLAPGTHQVQATAIGHQATTRSVQVTAGQVTPLTFRLAVGAVLLNEVLVTGQSTSTARREIGTSITSINASELESAPVTSVSQLLQSRAPGVTVLPGGGNAGEGSTIVLRGAGSLSQSVEPLIYVDGVRIDNSSFTASERTIALGVATGGRDWSGIDDIPPENIERIEIIKGAAAATLYGTEASAGVIQIFTKQGRDGDQVWSSTTEYGTSRVPHSYLDNVSIFGPYLADNLLDAGTVRAQQMAVRGSMQGFGYNVSGTVREDAGVIDTRVRSGSFRSNLRFTPSDVLTISANTGYSRRAVNDVPKGGGGYVYYGLSRGPTTREAYENAVEGFDIFNASSRITGGVTMQYTPTGRLTNRMTVGADVTTSDNTNTVLFGSPGLFARRWAFRRAANTFNLDLGSSYEAPLPFGVGSRTSVGMQAYSKDESWIQVRGFGAPGPITTIGGMATRNPADEAQILSKSAGFYAEQQFAMAERLFVTLGARADGHSSFGDDFEYQVYPKADVSWVVSEYGFVPEQVSTLRLRGAYGAAGQQPATFAALRTWRSVAAVEGLPGFIPENIGNPLLAPEVSRELEAGFDLGLLGERVSVEFTFYRQHTDGALYRVAAIPSQGFAAPQLANVAEVSNRGTETSVRVRVLDQPALRWALRTGYATNRNRVLNLGGSPPTNFPGSLQQVREGYPIGSFFGDRYIVRDGKVGLASELLRDASGELPEGWDFLGSPFPTRTFNAGSELTVARNLTMNVLVDFKGGHHLESFTTRALSRMVTPGDPAKPDSTLLFEPGLPVANWCRGTDDAVMKAVCSAPPGGGRGEPRPRGRQLAPARGGGGLPGSAPAGDALALQLGDAFPGRPQPVAAAALRGPRGRRERLQQRDSPANAVRHSPAPYDHGAGQPSVLTITARHRSDLI